MVLLYVVSLGNDFLHCFVLCDEFFLLSSTQQSPWLHKLLTSTSLEPFLRMFPHCIPQKFVSHPASCLGLDLGGTGPDEHQSCRPAAGKLSEIFIF